MCLTQVSLRYIRLYNCVKLEPSGQVKLHKLKGVCILEELLNIFFN